MREVMKIEAKRLLMAIPYGKKCRVYKVILVLPLLSIATGAAGGLIPFAPRQFRQKWTE